MGLLSGSSPDQSLGPKRHQKLFHCTGPTPVPNLVLQPVFFSELQNVLSPSANIWGGNVNAFWSSEVKQRPAQSKLTRNISVWSADAAVGTAGNSWRMFGCGERGRRNGNSPSTNFSAAGAIELNVQQRSNWSEDVADAVSDEYRAIEHHTGAGDCIRSAIFHFRSNFADVAGCGEDSDRQRLV